LSKKVLFDLTGISCKTESAEAKAARIIINKSSIKIPVIEL
jgi:hypothetical protein